MIEQEKDSTKLNSVLFCILKFSFCQKITVDRERKRVTSAEGSYVFNGGEMYFTRLAACLDTTACVLAWILSTLWDNHHATI